MHAHSIMKRLPVVFSFLLFLALSATLAYWLVQWTAPAPRPVSAPPKSERTIRPISAADSLFGGHSAGSNIANVQLRGVVYSGSLSDSVAIVAVEGKRPRTFTVNSEIIPGLFVKEILNKTVVMSEKGVERELSLPAFAAQESNTTAPQASMPPAPITPASNLSGAMNAGTSAGTSGSSNSQSSGTISPPPAQAASQQQGGKVPSAPEPARTPSGQ